MTTCMSARLTSKTTSHVTGKYILIVIFFWKYEVPTDWSDCEGRKKGAVTIFPSYMISE
jgi:hypothetical protein